MRRKTKEVTMHRKSRDWPMRLGERYVEIEYSGGKVIQRWRGSSGYVRLSSIDEFLVLT